MSTPQPIVARSVDVIVRNADGEPVAIYRIPLIAHPDAMEIRTERDLPASLDYPFPLRDPSAILRIQLRTRDWNAYIGEAIPGVLDEIAGWPRIVSVTE